MRIQNEVPRVRHVGLFLDANLNRSIALALVNRGRAMIGEKLFVAMSGASIPVQSSIPSHLIPKENGLMTRTYLKIIGCCRCAIKVE